jgi:hypothetical protein
MVTDSSPSPLSLAALVVLIKLALVIPLALWTALGP